MSLGILVQRRKHDWKDCFHVVAHKVAEVLIVPEVERTLGDLWLYVSVESRALLFTSPYLEVRTCHGLGQLGEEWLLHLGKFGGVHDFKNVFNLVEIHHLLRTVRLWPVAQ